MGCLVMGRRQRSRIKVAARCEFRAVGVFARSCWVSRSRHVLSWSGSVAWGSGLQISGGCLYSSGFAACELFDQVANGAFCFVSFRLPDFPGPVDLCAELLDLGLELINGGGIGTQCEFFLTASEVLFEVGAIATEFLLSFGKFGGGRLNFVAFGE
ncbi:MAG: hypothetical protein RL215_469 [Planctomycetota bacterium]